MWVFHKNVFMPIYNKEGEGDGREWDGWMASPTWWSWVWEASGVGDGQRSPVCCSPRGHKESDTTETELIINKTPDFDLHYCIWIPEWLLKIVHVDPYAYSFLPPSLSSFPPSHPTTVLSFLPSVMQVYVPRFFVSSQQRFGVTDIKAPSACHSSQVLDRLCHSSQVSNGPCYSS